MKFLTILTLTLLISCSGNKVENNQRNNVDPLDNLKEIDNKDFNSDNTIKYDPYKDNFEINEKSDVLSDETLGRRMPSDLHKYESKIDSVGKAVALCYQKKFTQAFEYLNSIYKLHHKDPSYWNQLGTCHLLNGNDRKAILYYNKSIDIDENYAPPLNNVGIIYLKQNFDQKAFQAFKKAKELNPYALTPIFNMAHLLLEYGLFDQAYDYFKILYNNSKSGDDDVLNGLATSLIFKGEFESSLNYYQKMSEYKLKYPSFGLNYSLALALTNKVKLAKTIFSHIEKNKLGEWSKHYNNIKIFLEGL